MQMAYCYKTDRAEACPYNISCDRETVEILANYALSQLRQAVAGQACEPNPEIIKGAFETYQRLAELLQE